MSHLYNLQADTCLLQETPLIEIESQKFENPYLSQMYSSCYNSKKQGVSDLISENIPFIHNNVTDPEEKFCCINISFDSNK